MLICLLLLCLSLVSYFRGPSYSPLSILWLVFTFLPTGLPWIFAIIQLIAIVFQIPGLVNATTADVFTLCISILSFFIWFRLHQISFSSKQAYENALTKSLGENYEAELRKDVCVTSISFIKDRAWLKPFSFKRDGVECLRDITYGAGERHKLDIYRPIENANGASDKKILRPVLLHTHGGGWVIGHKDQQSQPLLHYLTQNGWICVDINYRLAPKHRFPNQIIDVKTAIVWLKDNIANYGGDPNFIAITGGSAGGYLCSMSALSANQPRFQPGFEQRDTSLQAAVPLYGIYDFTELKDWAYANLKSIIMPPEHAEDMEYWKDLSPIYQIDKNAPPVFVIHGDCDTIFPIENVQFFVDALHEKSKAKVAYAKLRGVQHGFDIFHSVCTEYHIEAVGKFLHYCYGKHIENK
jgi:acetyl esterase/lipase